MIKKIVLYSALTGITAILASSVASASYVASDLISNSVFRNTKSMSTSQIQSFLQSKGGGLASYTQGGKRASQIIYEAAINYGVNPQVIIATLQKEQSLISDPEPSSTQLRSAMGYGCPDGADCNANYYGFSNQVHNGTWQLRYNYERANGNNTWWNNGSYACGGATHFYSTGLYPGRTVTFYSTGSYKDKTIKIANAATASLYCYTPHVGPYWETGYSGSYNFVTSFESWFGSTRVPRIFRSADSSQAYLFDGTSGYYKIPSKTVLYAYGYDRSEIQTIPSTTISSLTNRGSLGIITRFGGSEIYIIDQGRKFPFPNRDIYTHHGYQMGSEVDLDPAIATLLKAGTTVSEVINQSDNNAKFLMENSKRRHISNMTAYTTQGSPVLSSRPVTNLSVNYTNSRTGGTPVLAANSFARDSSTQETGFWDGTGFRPLSPTATSRTGVSIYTGTGVAQLPHTTTSVGGALIKIAGPRYFMMDSNQIFELTGSQLTQAGLSANSFVSVGAGFASAVSSKIVPYSPVVRINGSNEVYFLKDGARYQIVNPDALYELGYNFSNVRNINQFTAGLFPQAPQLIFATGTLVRVGGSDAVYIITSSSSKLHIPSRAVLDAYGYSLSSVLSVQSSRVSKHPTTGTLNPIVKDNAGVIWLVDSRTKRSIPSTYQGPSYYNLSPSTMTPLAETILSRLPSKGSMTPILQVSGDTKVYKIENGKRRWVTSRQALESAGFSFADVRTVSSSTLGQFPTGPNL